VIFVKQSPVLPNIIRFHPIMPDSGLHSVSSNAFPFPSPLKIPGPQSHLSSSVRELEHEVHLRELSDGVDSSDPLPLATRARLHGEGILRSLMDGRPNLVIF
jgi:hypothetical protein